MSERKTRRVSRKLQDGAKVLLGVGSTVVVGGGMAMGCLDRPIETVEPRTTSTNVQRLTQSSVDKIDVLLVIDNSGSMADKQTILSDAVPKLVERLVFPQCVDADGAAEPSGATLKEGPCPEGFKAEFDPIQDINIGIISSSIGAAGAEGLCAPSAERPNDTDNGRLIYRSTPDTATNDVPTYQNLGFLAWDPQGNRPCPGNDAEKCPGESDPTNLIDNLKSMVTGVGEFGCGFEAPLEAAYRFLADPAPWESFADPGQPQGKDQTILDQRAAFLRPDSLVAVILLTDENDCSLQANGLGAFGALPDGTNMPKPRAECATNIDDPCCASCIEKTPEGCAADPGCGTPGDLADANNFLSGGGDNPDNGINIRCWDQKRRFGVSFLYPVERYINAFSSPLINPGRADLSTDGEDDQSNPLFAGNRTADLVFVAGIAGVPWQVISRKNEAGEEDLLLGFQTYDEMIQSGAWDQIIPKDGADQADNPLMIESPDPRAGLETTYSPDAIQGNEWDTGNTDLQFACIFDLPESAQRDCETVGEGVNCDCKDVGNPSNRPLCGGANEQTQIRAKAYPSLRIFETLYGLGPQGIPASICPAQLDAPNANDYGYTPAVFAIIDRLKTKLGGACQPRQLVADDEGNVPCIVIEARDSDRDGDPNTTDECTCDITARRKPEGGAAIAAEQVEVELEGTDPHPGYDCLCEVTQLEGEARTECQNEETPSTDVNGWCYVDATSTPQVGNPALVSNCPASEQRLVRFVNEGEVKGGGQFYITCSGEAK